MTWTTDKPTQPGWYWWRSGNKETMGVYRITQSHFDTWEEFGMSGEWAGPLEVPR